MISPVARRVLKATCLVSFAVLLMAAPASLGVAVDGANSAAAVPEPSDYKTDDYRSPVPATLEGARTITVIDAEALIKTREAVFVDVFPRAPKPPNLPAGTVWRDPTHMTIEGAHWLPNVGYGVLSADFETYFKSRLANLTGNDTKKPVVFFCLRDCWMSWNAAKRALSWGYENVLWFSEGTDAWQEAGNDLVKAEPVQ